MKQVFVLITAVLLASCEKDPVTNDSVIIPPAGGGAGQIKFRGAFMDGPYGKTSGVVKIYESAGKYTLELDSFTVSSGPDLHVYLSQEVQPITFIDLGTLKATSGKQVYAITTMPDFIRFTYALIHCQQFNHLFGSADLMK